MERQVKGVVLEVSRGTMLLLTDGAELWSGPCPAAAPAVGDVVVVGEPAQRQPGRWRELVPLALWGAAAALVALVFAWNLPRQAATPAAIIIAVDINPSLELRLNPAGQVMAAAPRNADGTRLLAGLTLTDLPAAEAVAVVVAQAGALGYLPEDQPPVIMLAVAQLDGTAAAPDARALGEAARRAAARSAPDALVAVYTPNPSVLGDGTRLGLSPNAVTALNLARARGRTVDPAGLAANGLRQTLAAAGTSLPELLASHPPDMIVLGGPPVTVAPEPPAAPVGDDGAPPERQNPPGLPDTTAPDDAGRTGDSTEGGSDDDNSGPGSDDDDNADPGSDDDDAGPGSDDDDNAGSGSDDDDADSGSDDDDGPDDSSDDDDESDDASDEDDELEDEDD